MTTSIKDDLEALLTSVAQERNECVRDDCSKEGVWRPIFAKLKCQCWSGHCDPHRRELDTKYGAESYIVTECPCGRVEEWDQLLGWKRA